MKKHIKTSLILTSVLTFGLVGTTVLASCSGQAPKETFRIMVDAPEGVAVTFDKNSYEIGETVTFELKFDETKLTVESVSLGDDIKLFKLGNNKYRFIMPGKHVNLEVLAKEIIDLKGRLQELKDARNYTVVSRITFKDSSYDSIVYYTENANLMHLENDETAIEMGEINGETGVYNFSILENENGEQEFLTDKISYNSYKNNVKSFWDRKHDHGGFQNLDLSYISDDASEYVFKNKEFENQSNIFYNSGLDFSVYLSALEDIKVFVNEKGNIQFNISLGKHGKVTEEVVNFGKTKISVVEEFLANGGKESPAVLTEEQVATKKLIDGNNYCEVMPSVTTKEGKELQQGKIYYHPNYLFVDYTDEFLDFFKEANPGISINDNGYMQIGDKVYEFTVTYDSAKNPEFKLNENTVVTGELPTETGYLSTTTFMKDYNYAIADFLQVGPGQYIPFDRISDYDVAREAGEKIFHLDANQMQDELLLQTSQAFGMTSVVNDLLLLIYVNDGGAYAVSYEGFGKTKVQMIEDKMAELTK